jgi:hypothetical protein
MPFGAAPGPLKHAFRRGGQFGLAPVDAGRGANVHLRTITTQKGKLPALCLHSPARAYAGGSVTILCANGKSHHPGPSVGRQSGGAIGRL